MLLTFVRLLQLILLRVIVQIATQASVCLKKVDTYRLCQPQFIFVASRTSYQGKHAPVVWRPFHGIQKYGATVMKTHD